MKGLCQKCYTSGVKVMLTEVAKNEIGITEIPICDNCRDKVCSMSHLPLPEQMT